MKTTTIIAALIGAALFSLAGSAQAQYKPRGDDGISASPKLRQFLDEQKRNQGAPLALARTSQMACPKCKDTTLAVRDNESKGLGARVLIGKETKLLAKHGCDGCGTDWAVVGVGKGKKSVATHKCTSCGVENLACCNTTKGSPVATRGMEPEIRIAPLK